FRKYLQQVICAGVSRLLYGPLVREENVRERWMNFYQPRILCSKEKIRTFYSLLKFQVYPDCCCLQQNEHEENCLRVFLLQDSSVRRAARGLRGEGHELTRTCLLAGRLREFARFFF